MFSQSSVSKDRVFLPLLWIAALLMLSRSQAAGALLLAGPPFVGALQDLGGAPSKPVHASVFGLPDPDVERLRKIERATGNHSPAFRSMISGASPDYPAEAKRLGIQGSVGLEVTVDSERRVVDVRVIKSDNLLLSQAAIQMCSQPAASYDGSAAQLHKMAKYWRYWQPGQNRAVVDFQLSPDHWTPDSPSRAPGFLTSAPPGQTVMHNAFAQYPEPAKRERVQGEVTVELTVDASGEVAEVRATSGPEPLQDAALEAAWQWRFFPPPEWPVNVTVTYLFKLFD
jgi:TonB family protein